MLAIHDDVGVSNEEREGLLVARSARIPPTIQDEAKTESACLAKTKPGRWVYPPARPLLSVNDLGAAARGQSFVDGVTGALRHRSTLFVVNEIFENRHGWSLPPSNYSRYTRMARLDATSVPRFKCTGSSQFQPKLRILHISAHALCDDGSDTR
jgi:hypothetical protein